MDDMEILVNKLMLREFRQVWKHNTILIDEVGEYMLLKGYIEKTGDYTFDVTHEGSVFEDSLIGVDNA